MPDVFISYSRKDTAFARTLHAALAEHHRDTWVDWEDIPLTADWMAEIYHGIEAADVFVFIISPDSIASEICALEVAHAVGNHKRLVPVLRREVDAKVVPQPISAHNWLFFREQDDFACSFQALLHALETDLDYVRAHTRLLTRAIEWERKGHDASLLIRGSDLQEAEAWMEQGGASHGSQPTGVQRQYLLASRRAVTQRQRTLLGAVAATLVVTLLLALVAVVQWRDAVAARAVAETQRQAAIEQGRLATARQLAAQARDQADEQLDLALLLAVEANQLSTTPEVQASLLEGLQASPHLRAYLRQHHDIVTSVAFSPDGRTLAAASCPRVAELNRCTQGEIHLWDVATRQARSTPLVGHSSSIWSVAFSPDGRMLADGSADGTILLWNVTTGERVRELETTPRTAIKQVTFSPDGSTLASGDPDGTVTLWDVTTGQPIGAPMVSNTKGVGSIAFSPDGTTIASTAGGNILIWDVQSRQPRFGPLPADNVLVWQVAFSPDGMLLASAGQDGTVRLWDVARGRERGEPLMGHVGAISSLAFSPDGKTVVSGGQDGTVRLWETATGRALAAPLLGHTKNVFSVAFSADGTTLASGSADTTVILWDVAGASRLAERMVGELGVDHVAFGRDGKTLFAGHIGPTVDLWDLSAEQHHKRSLTDPAHPTWKSTYSPSTEMVALAGIDNVIRLWDARTGHPRDITLTGHTDMLWSLAFSLDGRLLASGDGAGMIRLWHTATGAPYGRSLQQQTASVVGLVFSPDGQTLVSTNSDATLLWDVATGELRAELYRGIDSYAHSVAFSANGELLALGRSDGSILLLDVATGHPQGEALSGHSTHVFSVAFSPDGRLLASAGADQTVRLWDVATRQRLGPPLEGHQGNVLSLAFSPDSTMLVSGSDDGAILLWSVVTKVWQQQACRVAGRALSAAEWQQYLPANAPYQPTCTGGAPSTPASSAHVAPFETGSS